MDRNPISISRDIHDRLNEKLPTHDGMPGPIVFFQPCSFVLHFPSSRRLPRPSSILCAPMSVAVLTTTTLYCIKDQQKRAIRMKVSRCVKYRHAENTPIILYAVC